MVCLPSFSSAELHKAAAWGLLHAGWGGLGGEPLLGNETGGQFLLAGLLVKERHSLLNHYGFFNTALLIAVDGWMGRNADIKDGVSVK
ncbi:hypothetical protein Tco_1212421 [Tanacetum coccineum]